MSWGRYSRTGRGRRAGGRGRRTVLARRAADVVRDADVADMPAGAGGADRLQHRLLGADGLDDGVGAEAAGQLLDLPYAVVAALGDDVGGAELEGELLAGLVPAHGDDPLRAELLGRQDTEQADRAVTDDRDGLAGSGLGGDGGEPAGAQYVGRGEQTRDQVVVRQARGGDERAVGQRDPQPFGLGAHGVHPLPLDAGGLVAGAADLAGVVGGEERRRPRTGRA